MSPVVTNILFEGWTRELEVVQENYIFWGALWEINTPTLNDFGGDMGGHMIQWLDTFTRWA